MLDNFIYSVNVILPIFILVMLGYLLKRCNFINDSFLTVADKLVFRVMLPSMIFLEVADSSIDNLSGNLRLIIFSICGVSGAFVAAGILICLFVKDNYKRGAMIQSSVRSNFAILAMPIAEGMFGVEGPRTIAVLMPFVILMYNVYSVIALSLFAPKENAGSSGKLIAKTARSVVTNPLIIAVILALPFMLFNISLPTFAEKSVTYLSNATTSLALISLGGGITFSSFKGKLKYSLATALTKTVILPGVMICLAYIAGLRGAELGILLILFGTPAAVSSYIMAKNMHSDHELAAQILLLTTLLCLITIFLGVFIMRTVGWI